MKKKIFILKKIKNSSKPRMMVPWHDTTQTSVFKE